MRQIPLTVFTSQFIKYSKCNYNILMYMYTHCTSFAVYGKILLLHDRLRQPGTNTLRVLAVENVAYYTTGCNGRSVKSGKVLSRRERDMHGARKEEVQNVPQKQHRNISCMMQYGN